MADDIAPPDASQVAPQDPQQLANVLQGANAINNVEPPQQQAQPDSVKAFLTGWLPAMQDRIMGLHAPRGFREGAAGGLLAASGQQTPQQVAQFQVGALQNLGQSAIQQQNSDRQLQALQYQQSMIPYQMPNGQWAYIHPKDVGSVLGKDVAGQYAGQRAAATDATKRLVAGYGQDGKPLAPDQLSIPNGLKAQLQIAQMNLVKARTDAANLDPTTRAGQAAMDKLNIAHQNASSMAQRAGAAAGMTDIAAKKYAMDYVSGFTTDLGQTMGLKQAGLGGQLPTTTQKNMGQMAATVGPHLDELDKTVDALANSGDLGPVAGRWEGALTGKVGVKNPEMAKGLAQAGLATSAMLRTHFGQRGGQQMYDKFVQQLNMAGNDPANIHAVVDVWRGYINGYAVSGQARPGQFNVPGGGRRANLVPPSGGGKQLDSTTAQGYLTKASGDKNRARAMARADGYSF